MSDPGIRATDRGVTAVERRLRKIYRQAERDLMAELRGFNMRFAARDNEMREKVKAGILTESQYKAWQKNAVYRGRIWDSKVENCTKILESSNRQALNIIRGQQMEVFAENATYQSYLLETGAGINMNLGIYNPKTVGNLIRKQPELLPRKVVDGVKDRAWNRDKIANCITQGIIKGDSIPQISQNMATTLSMQNDATMVRYARTAMTSAQNAGRIEVMEEAEEAGVNVKKKWIATLDSRTRDAHQDLDGQVVPVKESFTVEFDGQTVTIDYPGDPSCSEPGMVYNCRCTLGYVVDGETGGQRRAYREWEDEDGKHHRQSYIIENMTYNEWKRWKEGR